MKWLLILTLSILTGCASFPKWSESPADCAYETGKYGDGYKKDLVTGVAKAWTRKYICVESPTAVRLPAYIDLLNLPPAKEANSCSLQIPRFNWTKKTNRCICIILHSSDSRVKCNVNRCIKECWWWYMV